ncbi:MAG: AMP-binding protein, partial [Desulfobacterales bacterium]
MQNSNNIYDNFAETAKRRENHTAVFYLGSRYSYSRIRTLADRFASALTDMGVTAEQKVMLYIPNSINWVVS